MLEFTYNFVDKEDRSPGRKHAHGNIVKSKSCCTIFTDLNAFSLSVNSLNLLLFGERRRSILPFKKLRLENILSLVSYGKVYHLA